MQLLDDDMDELFRNAASQYPLKTDGSDWDAVMRRLPQSDKKLPVTGGRLKDNKWLRWLRWPLLTFIVFIALVPVLKTGELPLKEGSGNPVAQTVVTTTTLKSEDSSNSSITLTQNNNKINNSNSSIALTKNNKIKSSDNSIALTKNNKIKSSDNSIALTLNKEETTLHSLSLTQHEKEINADLQNSDQSIALKPDTTTKKTKSPKAPVVRGLYVGVVGSPDFSTVKGQRVSKTGYNYGLIAGYRISRSIAVETGVLFERKYYYSEGSYFDGKKIGVPEDMKIINVDGWCKMIEIPLNVRYVFGIREKSNWYANAGISSYIMSRENYDYKYERGGYTSTRNWDYRNATRNWFSIIHAGVGYEHRLGKIGTLRVEPYLKIPAKGIGIGNLPITSVGLNVGITKPIRF